MHSHANPYWTVELYGKAVLGISEQDVCFSAAKLFFAYGLGHALTFPISVGATVIPLADRPTPDRTCRPRVCAGGAGGAGNREHGGNGRDGGDDYPRPLAAYPASADACGAMMGEYRKRFLSSKFARSRISTIRRNGFSLVELMVVLFIIGLLSAVVLINVLPSQDRARVVKARADIATLSQALELYRLDAGHYPDEAEGLAVLKAAPNDAGGGGSAAYVRDIPGDPWGHAYQYHVPGTNGRPFGIVSLGGDGKPGGSGNAADIGEAGAN